jgi:hypothetical protein
MYLTYTRNITYTSEAPSETLHLHALIAFLDPALLYPTADNPLDFTNETSFSTHQQPSQHTMSKRVFKSQASSGRLPTGGFGGFGGSAFGSSQSSVLSYIQEAPDYSGISDANVVVAFKNLSKRDATTKAKALEDLLVTFGAPDATVEEGLLEAWVCFGLAGA